ncbi:hypothetical protein PLEOSDRAFT_1023682, partial [Pleurotus ostreatus PC15]
HSRYYLDDGDFYAVEDNIIFRVHAHFLRKHSNWIQSQALSVGRDKGNPLSLCESVTAEDFAIILWVFYDDYSSLERRASGKEWFEILLIAEKMQMPHVQLLALSKLKDLPVATDPLAKIAVQQRYSIRTQWAQDAYLELCIRPKPLTLAEGVIIGMPAMVKVADAREQM